MVGSVDSVFQSPFDKMRHGNYRYGNIGTVVTNSTPKEEPETLETKNNQPVNNTNADLKSFSSFDKEIIDTELQLKDLETVENQLKKVEKQANAGDKDAKALLSILKRFHEALLQGKSCRTVELEKEEEPLFLSCFDLRFIIKTRTKRAAFADAHNGTFKQNHPNRRPARGRDGGRDDEPSRPWNRRRHGEACLQLAASGGAPARLPCRRRQRA